MGLRLFLHAPLPARRAALAEMLALWPDLEVLPTADTAEAVLWDDPAPPGSPLAVPCLSVGPTPVRCATLMARLAALLAPNDYAPFAVGNVWCVPQDRALQDDEGQELARLTEKEVSLLQHLAQAGPTGVSRSDLLQRVWGYSDALETHTLETHIYRLRQKVEASPEDPVVLVTLEGGYALRPIPEPEA